MSQVDLIGEWIAVRSALTAFDRDVLGALGINRSIHVWGLVGASSITLNDDETLWEPGGSARAFITPCRIDPYNPHTPESEDAELVPCFGHLVDLVAWHPDAPDRWALRTGNAAWLGACGPQFLDAPMIVRRSPLSWLKARCIGVVALSPLWQERQRLLAIGRTLVAEDFEHAQELRQLMERPSYVPAVRVGTGHEHHAGTVET